LNDFDWFLEDYNGKTVAVGRSAQPNTLLVTLKNWVDVFAQYQEVRNIVTDLNSRVDFDTWYVNQPQPPGNLPKSLEWPSDHRDSIAMRFRLMLRIAEGSINFGNFIANRVGGHHSMQVKVPAFIDQVFAPLAHDLRIYIQRQHAENAARNVVIPASDRIVTLTHNQPDIEAFDKDIAELENALREANEFGQTASERRVKVEVTAFRELISQDEINLGVIERLFESFVGFLKDKVLGSLIANVLGKIIANWDKVLAFLKGLGDSI
jgi:hypothetical protein